ncbi:MAG: hypothetical protein WB762_14435, partial [Candidatus Sulfotelmatobacter sp.]
GETILNVLLPGLTNSTVHPRYYAFFSWVFKLASDAKIKVGKPLVAHVFRYDTVLIYAAQAMHGEDIYRVVGIKSVREGPHKWLGASRKYSISRDQWQLNRVSAFSSPYYRPSFERLRLLLVEADGTIVLRPEGQILADAFERQLSSRAAAALSKLGSNRVSGHVLRQLHDDFCPCGVRQMSRGDRSSLIEVLFRRERPSPDPAQAEQERARRLSLAFVLHLVKECGSDVWDGDSLRTLIYYWQSPSRAYFPAPQLRRTAEAWRVFQAQQYERYAIETLWASFVRIVARDIVVSFDLAKVSTQVISHLKEQRYYQNRGLRFARDLATTSLGEFSSAVLNAIKTRSNPRAPDFIEESWQKFRSTAAFSEAAWVAEIKNALWTIGNPYQAFGAAVGLLAVLCLRWAGYRPTASGSEFLRVGGQLRLSLGKVIADFESRRDEPLNRVFSWILEEYVIGQHLRVAAQKLATEGIDTFWFSATEDGYRLHPERNPSDARPTYSGTKIIAARSCLYDLGLIDSSRNSTYRCTNEGRNLLNAVLKSSVAAS